MSRSQEDKENVYASQMEQNMVAHEAFGQP